MEPNPIEKKSMASLSPSEPQGFTDVWIAYPVNRRNQRREAARLVAKALDEGATIESILAALEAEKQSSIYETEIDDVKQRLDQTWDILREILSRLDQSEK